MRKFLVKLILVISPFFLAGVSMEYFLRQIPNDFMSKKNYLDKHSNEVETLILGGSHTYYGLNPNYFSTKTYNAANVAQPLDFDFKLFEKYQNNFNSLKTIIISISYPTLWGQLDGGFESWRIKNYVIYYNIKHDFTLQNYTEIFGNSFDINVKRLTAHYINKRDYVTCDENGWGANNNSINSLDLDITGKNAASKQSKKHLPASKLENDLNENISFLDSIINWGLEHDVEIIFLLAPSHKTYIENLDEWQLNKVMEVSNHFDEKYDNCRFINFLEHPSFVDEDYFDGDHLNEIGAKKLSLLMDEEIRTKN